MSQKNIEEAFRMQIDVPAFASDYRWKEKILQQIDVLGGWPLEAHSLVRIHGSDECYFSKSNRHDENSTSFVFADDWYAYKLSDNGKDKLRYEGFEFAKKGLSLNPFFKRP
jgi:hypothetical protein